MPDLSFLAEYSEEDRIAFGGQKKMQECNETTGLSQADLIQTCEYRVGLISYDQPVYLNSVYALQQSRASHDESYQIICHVFG
jgi:hypothetical protein